MSTLNSSFLQIKGTKKQTRSQSVVELRSYTIAQKVFKPAPLICFRSARNSNVYPSDSKAGSIGCNKKRLHERFWNGNVWIFSDQKPIQKNHNLNYSDKCLIYLLCCKICDFQNETSTTNTFRWNNYKDNNKKAERGAKYLQADLLEHFASQGHNKTDDTDHTRKEEYWRKVLKTVSPYWLNTVTYKSYILACLLYIFARQECWTSKMFNSIITISCLENLLMKVCIILKLVNWFTLQISWWFYVWC